MGKSKDKKKIKKQVPEKEKPFEGSENEKENSFDFGGLPNRDLKKNLGCG